MLGQKARSGPALLTPYVYLDPVYQLPSPAFTTTAYPSPTGLNQALARSKGPQAL